MSQDQIPLPPHDSPLHQCVQAACARCRELGVPAAVLAPSGTVLEVCADTPTTEALVRALPFAPCPPGPDSPLTEVAPGVSAGLIPIRDDRGACLCIAPVFPGQTPAQAHPLYRTLRANILDLASIQTHAGDIENFTEQLAHAYDTIDLLYTLGRAMGQPNTPKEFLASLCARTRAVMGFAWVAACFEGDASIPLGLRNVTAVEGDMLADLASCRRTLLEWTTRGVQPVIHERVPALGGDTGQVISQPLMLRGRAVGILAAGGKQGPDPLMSSYDSQLFEACAGFLATFLDNVALYDDQKQLFMGTLQALTGAIDAKDRYTCGHSERVSILSWQLAEAAGLSMEDAERVRIAGLVHDVGKIGVPDAVLTKPGKLTDDEFGAIKLHPDIGHRILLPVPQLTDVLPGVLHHHERYDGKGYPSRIAGEDIPLMARIIAVADTFDAMSSDRSYRKKLTREQVLAEITRCAGTQLDPRLAALMVRMDLDLYDEMTLKHAAEACERKAA